ncbi:protein GID8 homolog isoform X2 [Rosa rugosa]|uniref:protein GID8 homolog isoform X2 n=1 Tax=Rosa rugosa TaxID=74645 RepID=UPI002B405218|nr:protein GID8 homolog isoform X2 [Rosa rugosa]
MGPTHIRPNFQVRPENKSKQKPREPPRTHPSPESQLLSLTLIGELSTPLRRARDLKNEPRGGGALMSLFLSSTIDQAYHQLAEIEAELKAAMAGSKKVITRDEWEKKLNDVKIKKEDMNKLVMNFLVTEGYVDAAEKFRKESGTEHIDLATITDRMAVKKAVQCGNVEDAIEKVNDLNPEILDTNPQLFFHLQQQRLIELIRNGKVEEALEFAQEELAPRGEENQSFLEELERTVALLAFEDVSNCPVGELLDISQRLKTASEVNAAILTSQSHEKDPKLPSLLKMLIWAQNQLDEKAHYPRINDLSTARLEDPSV